MGGIYVLMALAAAVLAALYFREWLRTPGVMSRFWWAAAHRMWDLSYEAGQAGDTELALHLSQIAADLEALADPEVAAVDADWRPLP